MIFHNKSIEIDTKALLSTFWIFILFNIIFRDIHEFVKPGFIEEVMTGTMNGVQITEALLLLGGIMVEIPISMVLLSRILKYKVNRWANIITGALMITFVINNGVKDLDDIFFASIEILSLSLIIWIACKWHNSYDLR